MDGNQYALARKAGPMGVILDTGEILLAESEN